MFRAIVLPIFRNIRLGYSLWYEAPYMLSVVGLDADGLVTSPSASNKLPIVASSWLFSLIYRMSQEERSIFWDPKRYNPKRYNPKRYNPKRYNPKRYNPKRYKRYNPKRYNPKSYNPKRYNLKRYYPIRYNPKRYNPNKQFSVLDTLIVVHF
jgi:hypothetical protein